MSQRVASRWLSVAAVCTHMQEVRDAASGRVYVSGHLERGVVPGADSQLIA